MLLALFTLLCPAPLVRWLGVTLTTSNSFVSPTLPTPAAAESAVVTRLAYARRPRGAGSRHRVRHVFPVVCHSRLSP
jgi:hypothetical protein